MEKNEEIAGRRFVCHHHRSALIKSLLNFLKRAIVDSGYINHSRRIMDGDYVIMRMSIQTMIGR